MTMISYGQDGEDVLLQRAFPERFDGFYIDVGANDPLLHSVTKHFSNRGWRGINIEPVPSLHERLRADRPRDVNLNAGLSDREGRVTFHECESEPSWSTFSPEVAAVLRKRGCDLLERDVAVTTLAGVCDRYADAPIDFLKIDVEGFEREVIEGADWGRWRPRVVLVENSWPESWEPLLLGADYLPALRTELNRCYVRAEDRHLLGRLSEPLGRGDDFVRHRHARLVRDLNDWLARGEDFGPKALKVACRLHRAAVRHPRLASVCRSLLGLAG